MDRWIKEEYMCVCLCMCMCLRSKESKRETEAESTRREYETEVRENSIVGVYTAFTDQVITRNASRVHSLSLFLSFSLSLAPFLSLGLRTARNAFNINHLRVRYGTLSYGRPPRK